MARASAASNPIEGFCQPRAEASCRIYSSGFFSLQPSCLRVLLVTVGSERISPSEYLWTRRPSRIEVDPPAGPLVVLSRRLPRNGSWRTGLSQKPQTANQDALNRIKMNAAETRLRYSLGECVQCVLMVTAGIVTSVFVRGRLMAGVHRHYAIQPLWRLRGWAHACSRLWVCHMSSASLGISVTWLVLSFIYFFNVFIEQLHGWIVNMNNKQHWLKELGSCLFYRDGRPAS